MTLAALGILKWMGQWRCADKNRLYVYALIKKGVVYFSVPYQRPTIKFLTPIT